MSCNATKLPGYHLNLPSISVPNMRKPITIIENGYKCRRGSCSLPCCHRKPAWVSLEPTIHLRSRSEVSDYSIENCHQCKRGQCSLPCCNPKPAGVKMDIEPSVLVFNACYCCSASSYG
uniref:Uncharacterized protein n=1 Tax=Arundo donax TaxID=35708 RepID=A0A0A9S6S8_ARUDO